MDGFFAFYSGSAIKISHCTIALNDHNRPHSSEELIVYPYINLADDKDFESDDFHVHCRGKPHTHTDSIYSQQSVSWTWTHYWSTDLSVTRGGDVATNLVSVMHPEWWSREKQDKRRDRDIAFCSVNSVTSHTATKEIPACSLEPEPLLSVLIADNKTQSKLAILCETSSWVASLMNPVRGFVLGVKLKDRNVSHK